MATAFELDPASEEVDLAGGAEFVLRRAATNFSDAPLRNGKVIRELCRANLVEFREAAISILREDIDVRGCRYLVTVLWVNHQLIAMLSDTSLPKEIALKLGATAAKVDPQLHIKLIQFLIAGMLEGKDIVEECANRLLEVLAKVTDGIGAQRFIRQMLRHPSPRIRSKVTLLLDHGGPGIRALQSILKDPEEDQRVRANALEALWTANRPEFNEIFLSCLEDADNRVAGNAVLGLYFAGDTQSVAKLIRMAEHDDGAFRRTAIWVMGKTRDPRFLSLAGRFLGEPNKAARNTVFKAVQAIKTASNARSKEAPLIVTMLGARTIEGGWRRLRVAVTSSMTGKAPSIPATGFAIYAGQEPIADYSCVEQKSDRVSIGFILPRRTRSGDQLKTEIVTSLMTCLDTKSKVEHWNISRFREPDDLGARRASAHFQGQNPAGDSDSGTAQPWSADPAAPKNNFTGNAATLKIEIESPGPSFETNRNFAEAALNVLNGLLPVRGTRHLVVIVDESDYMDERLVEQLTKTAGDASTALHALCFCHDEQIARACADTGGIYRALPVYTALGPELALLYSALKSHYVLDFWPVEPIEGEPLVFTVHVNTEEGCGMAGVNPVQKA